MTRQRFAIIVIVAFIACLIACQIMASTERVMVPLSQAQVFTATAYCKGTITASGVAPRMGVMAADPAVLPLGSVVHMVSNEQSYTGIYTILDTGPMVVGQHLDLYIWSCYEALRFGKRLVRITVLRFGWDPQSKNRE